MAIRNSVKATLFETEQPRSRSDEADAIFEEPAPPVAERPIEKPGAERPIEKPSAQRPVEKPSVQRSVEKSVAPRSAEIAATAAPVAPPKPPEAAFRAATWHARAEELCVLADTLPSKSSWSLISKIAGLYDELARDAGWAAPEKPPPEALRLEEAQQVEDEPSPGEAPPTAAPADPRPEDRIAFERRPLPQGRRFPRRRA